MKPTDRWEGRRRIRFGDVPAALAGVIRDSIQARQMRKAAGSMPELLGALSRVDDAAARLEDEVMVLHLAALDIALQIDGRFNGLVHRVILGRTVDALATSGSSLGGEEPAEDGDVVKGRLESVLRMRLPVYLDWMYDFVSAQLEIDVQEPREVLRLDDPADSAVVILALGELLSLYHGTLSRWALVN